MIIVEAPFQEELSGMVIIKVLDMNEHVTSMRKLKFIRNKATLKITNNTNDIVTFDRKDMIGFLDIRSLGYYKVKQEVLQSIWVDIIILSFLKMSALNLTNLSRHSRKRKRIPKRNILG